jgi:hypothetical protein
MKITAQHYANTYRSNGTTLRATVTTHFTRTSLRKDYADWMRELMGKRGSNVVSVYEGEDVVIKEVSYE